MDKQKAKLFRKDRRAKKVRAKVSGSAGTPRLSVFRSNRGMYLQLIDDESGKTLASAGMKEAKSLKNSDEMLGGKERIAFELGKLVAGKAKAKNISKAVFDRNGNKYHGRVKAAADGAREGGLDF
jgi:large subunit ribosomal protein L18